MPWLRLIRWKNLLILFLAQLLAWVGVILPEQTKQSAQFALLLNTTNFLCITLSTILIAAAGYIINDYFDIKIDLINRPEKVILGKQIPRKTAIIAHTVLNVAALGLAGFVAAQVRHYEWILLQAGCTVLLWFYSTHLKRQYITGNVAVALLSALTIVTLIVYEPALHKLSLPAWVLIIYSCFAFLLTWMREIVKDMEDFKGDEAEGCITMPIKRGLGYAAGFTTALAILVVLMLAIATFILFTHKYLLLAAYTFVFLAIPIAVWTIYLHQAHTEIHYGNASRGLKIIMISGICSLLIYHFQIS